MLKTLRCKPEMEPGARIDALCRCRRLILALGITTLRRAPKRRSARIPVGELSDLDAYVLRSCRWFGNSRLRPSGDDAIMRVWSITIRLSEARLGKPSLSLSNRERL